MAQSLNSACRSFSSKDHNINWNQGMILLASKSGCRVWHRRLRCIVFLNKSKSCLSRSGATLHYSTSHLHYQHDLSIRRTRNIGIIAHIDAVRYSIFKCIVVTTHIWLGKNNYHGAYALLQWFHSSNRGYGVTFLICHLCVVQTFLSSQLPQSPYQVRHGVALV